ncbi:MAG: hypothetical protein FJX40_13875 [Alphaproteobacteria bacterium]|nr:hypothetical protein [Alphaproteobacteria bacterium]MBM3641580.1 hypothetical protein [Alphaproteobacteria bacterium]
MSVHLALLYSDGSMGVLSPGATLDQAEKDRAFADEGERDPARLTKIARVACPGDDELREFIERKRYFSPGKSFLVLRETGTFTIGYRAT